MTITSGTVARQRGIGKLVAERARERADAPAFLAPGRAPLSYGALCVTVDEIVGELRRAGLGPGARLALSLPNGPGAAVVTVAALASAVCVPFNPALEYSACERLLEQMAVDALFASATDENAAVAAAQTLGLPILRVSTPAGATPGPAGAVEIRVEAGRPRPTPITPPSGEIALVLHTSGTTARPKVVPLTHDQVMARSGALPIGPADRCLCVAPLFTGSALNHSLVAPLAAGAAVLFPDGADADAILDAVGTLEATYFSASPTVLLALVEALRRRGSPKYPSLRFLRSSSSALAPAAQERVEEAFGLPVLQGYGMTEVGTIAQNPLPPLPRKRGSVGLSAGPEIAILDDAGGRCRQGLEGAVVVRSAGMTSGYAGDDEATRSAFEGGWFRTGDRGYLDADGYLFLTGRVKDIVNRGGLKVAPGEVEETLLGHPDIHEAAAFGIPHPTLGEDLAAAVVLHNGASATVHDLLQHARAHLARFKVPTRIVLVEALPRNALGKVKRTELASALGSALARRDFVPPGDAGEHRVAAIFAEVLALQQPVSATDNFFVLGGDSLRAMQVVNRLNTVSGTTLTVDTVFRSPSVAQLASELAARATR